MKRQQGFTLIELIVVIVILGILGATALPKFLDVQKDARKASLSGVAGAVQSAANLAHAQQLVAGSASNTAAVLGGQNINMSNGYPDTSANGIILAASLASTEWTYTAGSNPLTIQPINGGSATCQVSYTPATAAAGPAVAITNNGC